jgi:diguanylate cyclase (GGDEF)-like protein
MDEEILWSLIQASHAAAWNLIITLTKRLRQANQVITEDVDVEQVYERYGSVDAMTGLHNRHWLDMMLPRLVQRAAADNESFSVVMLDVDHFQEFNEQYGRIQGDRILYSMVHTITDNLRPSEWMVRYADDEFALLLPSMDVQAARDIAERLHKAVMDAVPIGPDGRSVPYPTISIGIAELEAGQTPEMLLEAAETAIYQAKSSGRNQIVVLSPPRDHYE